MRLMLPILNFWREAQAHADGSVPGWLSVGTMTLFPPLEPGAQIQSLITRMPAAVRKAEPLFPTIERGQGYVNLKVGQYQMKHSKKKRAGAPGGVINCLQCMDGPIDQILIHDALNDNSLKLAGCIAPGTRKKPGAGMGVLDSADAMKELFRLLGGYTIGKLVTLNVWSNVPGDMRTRHTWAKLKGR